MDLEGVGHCLAVVEEVALEPAADDDSAADGERDVVCADEYVRILLRVACAYALDIRKRRAGHDKLVVFLGAFDVLAAYREAIAVDRDHGQRSGLDLEQRACVHRAAVVIADGEHRLVYHALEHALLYFVASYSVNAGQLGIFAAVHAHERELGFSALDGGFVILVGGYSHHTVGHAAHHLAEKLRVEDYAAGFGNVGLNSRIYAFFKVVPRYSQPLAGFEQNALERRDGAFRGGRSCADCNGCLKNVLFT